MGREGQLEAPNEQAVAAERDRHAVALVAELTDREADGGGEIGHVDEIARTPALERDLAVRGAQDRGADRGVANVDS